VVEEQYNPLYSGSDQAVHENPLYDPTPEPEPAPKAKTPMQNLADALRYSVKGGITSVFSMTPGENSQTFQSIVDTLDDINHDLEQNLTGDVKSDAEKLAALSQKYGRLIQTCEVYMDRRLVLTAAGKERQRLVRQVYDLALRDKVGLDGGADNVFNVPSEERRSLSVKDLIAESRMLRFSVGDINANVGGASASTVYKLQHNGGEYFFKREENVLVYGGSDAPYFEKAFQETIDNLPNDPDHERLRQNLLKIKGVLTHIGSPSATMEGAIQKVKQAFELAGVPLPSEDAVQELAPIVKRICKTATGNATTADNLRMIGVRQRPGGPSEVNVSKRNVATSRMAELLGAGHLIARSETAEVTDAATGQKFRGNLMAKAEGVEDTVVAEVAKEHRSAEITSGGFQRAMICVQMLDNICGQIDRHDKNRMYQLRDGVITGIQGIDNDLAFGESGLLDSVISHAKAAFAQTDTGIEMAIPYMDKEMAQNIIELAKHPVTVRYVMTDLLRPVEIDALIDRLTTAANALQAAMQADHGNRFEEGGRFLAPDDWSAHKDEIHANLMEKGKKQVTYYSDYMQYLDSIYGNAQKAKAS